MNDPLNNDQEKADQLSRAAKQAAIEGDQEKAAKLRAQMDELYEKMERDLEMEPA